VFVIIVFTYRSIAEKTTTVRRPNRLSHPNETRRDHRRTNFDGCSSIGGACGSYHRCEGYDDVEEVGEET
jgi:hypothetical protein